ncbi:MAG TPA: twin-arginine translocase subunit TatC [Gemmatimonadales bacterium]|nr:twin-arginine translocase subunit TatC [Gemmatimonadales bacterium]
MRPQHGELPFLEHLEELRVRILRALLALVAGVAIGLWLVERYRLVALIKEPIARFLPEGKLTVLSPTDPVMIVLKLSVTVGLVLASPVIIWQLWAFLAPALYEREKKALVPALFAGLGLFLAGSAFAWLIVVPKALQVLLSFQAESFNTLITYNEYFGFVLQVVLAMGLSAELPLLMIILTALGITTPATFGRFRRVAVVLAFIAGAFLSPGADVFSMLMMTAPLLLLYEVGIAVSVLIHRRQLRRGATAAVVLLLVLVPGGGGLEAQVPFPPQQPLQQQPFGQPGQDSVGGRVGGRKIDSASARRLGLPSAPSRQFGTPDSVLDALLGVRGFIATRYLADTAIVEAAERRIRLLGNAMTERQGTILEARTIGYQEARCDLVAQGDPKLFDKGQVLIGDQIRYDTCLERGIVSGALTSFAETGANWFVRGNLVADSSSSRLYAAGGEITSCDLPIPDYHFATKEVKWISQSMLVARSAVLYVRDVPVAWVPFIFQDTKSGRRSGILVPQFGFNDIVRPTPGYNRQVTNAGYYWAPNDYFDLAGRFDWYANRYFRWSVTGQYNVRDRFFRGAVEYSEQREVEGAVARSIRLQHSQTFGLTTTMAVNLNLTSNSRVISSNALDPLLSTQQLSSDLNLTRRFKWGSVALGGRRRQTLGEDQLSQQLPSLTITPKPIDFGSAVTWSPAFSALNDLNTSGKTYIVIPRLDGTADSVEQTPETRIRSFNLDTPLRIGSFNWRNNVTMTDREETKISGSTSKIPNDLTPDPTDSISVSGVLAGSYSTELNWDTGINLPLVFRSTWKVTPSIGITNTTGGAFAVRNQKTEGAWVTQGKRLSFGVGMAPTLFGFFPGFGPVSRIRHSIQPVLSWSYAPAADIPREYAEAIATNPTQPLKLRSDATQTITLTLSNNFEAKERVAGDDSAAAARARKFRILGISTSGLSFDLEQAKKEGRTGWATQTITNTFQSDLVPGFNLSLTHDLWDGPVGTEGTKFDLFLQNVTASFGLSGRTFQALGALIGLGQPPTRQAIERDRATVPTASVNPMASMQQRSLYDRNQLMGARRGFTANVNLSISRARPVEGGGFQPEGNSNLGFSTSFSPTRFWGVSWSTQYNVTRSQFESQILRLERDLHDWRAGFNFVKNPNGNFAFYFTIHLIDLPDLKLDYNQSTIKR